MLLRGVLVALGLGGLGVLAAGCGGGTHHSPGVAQIGTSVTTTSSVAATPAGSAGPQSSTALVPFVDCMQKHGVQAQLAPHGSGLSISGGAGPNSPNMQKAQLACQKLLPGGGPKPLSPAQEAVENTELLSLAACMRTHGYPGFPDPNGQGTFDLTGTNGLDPSSTQFQAAMNTCQPRNSSVPLQVRVQSRASSGGPGPASAGMVSAGAASR